jgi:DNA-binding NtrC family response regulator
MEQFKPKFILLVDDDIEILKALSKTLEREGYNVVSYHNAEVALMEIKHKQPLFDLVITDESMPGMRGMDFLVALKKIWPDLPVIIMTAFGDWGQYMEAMRAGAFDFLTKPVNKSNLLTVVHRALSSVHAPPSA